MSYYLETTKSASLGTSDSVGIESIFYQRNEGSRFESRSTKLQ